MIKELERLRVGTQVWRRKGLKNRISACTSNLKGRCNNQAKLSTVASSARTRGNKHKLNYRRFHPNISKYFFLIWVTEHSHRVPQRLRSLHSRDLQRLPGHGPGQLAVVALLEEQGWTREHPGIPQPLCGCLCSFVPSIYRNALFEAKSITVYLSLQARA